MIAIVTILFALPLGYLCRSGTAAYVAYVAVYSWALTFQTLYLLLPSLGGDDVAFSADEFPWSYGVVTLSVYVVGFGLVTLGRRLRAHRQLRRHPVPA